MTPGRRRAEPEPQLAPVRAVAFSLALMALANIATVAACRAAFPSWGWLLVAVLAQFAAGSAAAVAWMWSR